MLLSFAICLIHTTQQSLLSSSDSQEDAKIVGRHTVKADGDAAGVNVTQKVKRDIKKKLSKGVPNAETHLAETAAVNSEEKPNTVQESPLAVGSEQQETKLVAETTSGSPSPVNEQQDAQDGLVTCFVNRVVSMLQTDFNFLISSGTVVSAVLTQLIPMHTIMTIRSNRSTGSLKALNFVTSAFANFLWALYGVLSSNSVIILSNMPGFLLSCFYIAVFHRNCLDTQQKYVLRVFYKFTVFCCLIMTLAYLAVDLELYLKFIGLFGGSIQAFSYITPLLSIKEVMRQRSTSAMPMEISLANFIGSFFTLCYGFIIWDYIVIAPNFIGTTSGMIQVAILVLITNSDKIVITEVDILEKQQFKPTLIAELEI